MSLQLSRPSSEPEISWTEPKKNRRQPQIQCSKALMSRESGMLNSSGTFGKGHRSDPGGLKTGAPSGDVYYSRHEKDVNPFFHGGKKCGPGVGGRSEPDPWERSGKEVSPDSYSSLVSPTKKKSPMDGAKYCTMTIAEVGPTTQCILHQDKLIRKLPTHAMYQIRKDLDHDQKHFKKAPMAHGTRHRILENDDGPGPGMYEQSFGNFGSKYRPKTTGSAKEKPADKAKSADKVMKPETPKCTFGNATRFKVGSGMEQKSCSPNSHSYYAHFSFPTAENYMEKSKTCGFGGGEKTDHSNELKTPKNHQSQVSPNTYFPDDSAKGAMRSSMINGFSERCVSPILTGSRLINMSRGFGRNRCKSAGTIG